jgi:hypothetical protein
MRREEAKVLVCGREEDAGVPLSRYSMVVRGPAKRMKCIN